VLDTVVKVCAIVGAALGVFNFYKAWRRDRREAQVKASQHLVKAICRTVQTDTHMHVSRLYVINNDTQSVSDVKASFFRTREKNAEPAAYPIGCLSPGQEFFINQFGRGDRGYAIAEFTYVDAGGHRHEYEEDVYRQQH
jgi:hypothetical protein